MIKKLFLSQVFILVLILLNSVIIFAIGFDMSTSSRFMLSLADNTITGLFVIEIIVKLREQGIRNYFKFNTSVTFVKKKLT